MRTPTALPRKTYDPSLGLAQAGIAMLLGASLFLGALLVFAISYSLAYAGCIYPGVRVAGLDLSGLSAEEAAQRLSQHVTFPAQGRIIFQDGAQIWAATPAEAGLFLNPNASAAQALQIGRRGGPAARLTDQLRAWNRRIDLPPLLVYDERIGLSYLNTLAAQVDRPTVEASLSIQGLEVVVQPGQVGRRLDIPASLDAARQQLQTLQDGVVPLVIHETPPAILDASQQAEIARRILSAPLTLQAPDSADGDPGPWVYQPDELARMLTIERASTPQGDQYQVGLDTSSLRSLLEEQAGELARQPQNARFIFNDDSRELEVIENAVIGRSLLVEESLQRINEQLRQGEHNVELVFDLSAPAVTDETSGESLGITELVSQYISYFYGSSPSRIQNIATAAARFHGVLVPPGATFSMAEVLGDVTLDNGYAEALIIYGDRTIKGVGGGVCQVSTTLFRTAFFGGFPILERHPHAYRVSYYEQRADASVNPRLAGLDATVFVPYVDFKFQNDTDHWLLMETYVNETARTLTWKFYSTSDGRTVEWDTSGPENTVEPPKPLYQENPDLPKGTIKQVDWAAEGADVVVTRTVYRNGQVYFSDRIATHYEPWRAVYEYGPGTKVPKDKDKDKNDD